MKLSLTAVGAAFALASAACAGPAAPTNDGCRRAAVGVVWTSSARTDSYLSWHDGHTVVAEQRFDAGRVEGVGRPSIQGTRLTLIAKGTMQYDEPRLVNLAMTSCATTVAPGPLAPLAADVGGEAIVAAGNVDGKANVSTTAPDGTVLASASIPGFVPSQVLRLTDTLILFGVEERGNTRSPQARVLDPKTLAERTTWDAALAGGAVSSALLVGGMAYVVSDTADGRAQAPGHKLSRLDLATGQLVPRDLPSKQPASILRSYGGKLYVGHTFMNEAFGPMHEYRDVSIVDAASGTAELKRVDFGIARMEFVGGLLWVLGLDAQGAYHLSSYDPATLARRSDVVLRSPAGSEHYPSMLVPGARH